MRTPVVPSDNLTTLPSQPLYICPFSSASLFFSLTAEVQPSCLHFCSSQKTTITVQSTQETRHHGRCILDSFRRWVAPLFLTCFCFSLGNTALGAPCMQPVPQFLEALLPAHPSSLFFLTKLQNDLQSFFCMYAAMLLMHVWSEGPVLQEEASCKSQCYCGFCLKQHTD